jgi:hypothetical protein
MIVEPVGRPAAGRCEDRGMAIDRETSGFGARPGWRAPKGGRGARRNGAPTRTPPAASDPAAPDAAAVDPAVAGLARLAGLGEDATRRLARQELPTPGAPDAIPAALRAVGAVAGELERERDAERRRADTAEQRRTRDAERQAVALERARSAEARQRTKAGTEQGERQRLTGELERAHGELAQLRAEAASRRRADGASDAAASPGETSASGRGGASSARERDAEHEGLVARVADLERQLDERGQALDVLTGRAEAAEAEQARLLVETRRLRRQAIEAGADVDLVDPQDVAPLRIDDLPEVRTCLEAVQLAARHAQHLVYTDRAFDTARSAPYDEPRKLLRDLVALDRVAAAWNAPGGTGRPIRDVARDEGLEWADDVSATALGQHPREYLFVHAGRQLWAGPHVKVATGRGMRRTCRVYLALVKGDEADLAGLPRGAYVGPVGKHLSDSTTG